MVMDVYTALAPKHPDTLYTLEEITYPSEADSGQFITLLGVFDLLETALHALDVVSKYRSSTMKLEDLFMLRRIPKNTLKMNSAVPLAKWTVTAPPKDGISNGELELCPFLRTHDVE